MSLSIKQRELLDKLYNCNSKHLTLNEFCREVVDKNENELTFRDLNKIIRYANGQKRATQSQKEYIVQIFKHLQIEPLQYINNILKANVNNLEEMSQCNVSDVLKHVSNNESVFIPTRINLDRYTYEIQHKTSEYALMKQVNKLNSEKNLDLISFRGLMVCDWDDMTLPEIENILKTHAENYRFKIYETYNGYHGYCVSHSFDHHDFDTLQFMYKLYCDKVYISFTKLNGFMVRICKKPDRDETFIEKYVKDINRLIQPDPCLIKLVELKDQIISNNLNKL